MFFVYVLPDGKGDVYQIKRKEEKIIELVCVVCGKPFAPKYKWYKQKCCSSECLSKLRSETTTYQRQLNYDNVIGKIEKYLCDNYYNYGIVRTLQDCYCDLHISSKTYYKYSRQYNITYQDILTKHKIPKTYSKFQTTVTKFIRQYYPDYYIVEEATFDKCVNPTTNYKLRFDIFIPEINTIIECDGKQHYDKNSYFNKKVIKDGHTPVYETDKIKKEFCKTNNINIIRIPYKERITKEYVEAFLTTTMSA